MKGRHNQMNSPGIAVVFLVSLFTAIHCLAQEAVSLTLHYRRRQPNFGSRRSKPGAEGWRRRRLAKGSSEPRGQPH